MVRAKAGDVYVCDECGMTVTVEEACTCDTCGIVCCDVPMVKTGTTKKAGKKAAPAKARPKKAKAAVKRKAARW